MSLFFLISFRENDPNTPTRSTPTGSKMGKICLLSRSKRLLLRILKEYVFASRLSRDERDLRCVSRLSFSLVLIRALFLIMREWVLKQGQLGQSQLDQIERLGVETRLSPLTLQICLRRGLDSAEVIQKFLAPRLEQLQDPFTIQDMSLAVDRVIQARDASERVRVFGDYDVDGTTGAALLSWFFRDCQMTYDVRQPDRFKDGYGLNVGAVEAAVAEGVRLLITVDCGITSFAAIEKARELGLDVIVVDHHQIDPVKGLPPAMAVVNPQRKDCGSELKQLCGCGLAFYLARALRTRGRELAWWPAGQEPNLKKHLDLVVIATAADMVPLTGDNHVLVKQGLQVLKHSQKPGVKALLDAAGVSQREISPGHLGFVLGPRINASGRLGSADTALRLLTTQDPEEAAMLAMEIEQMNKERANIQNQIWDQVKEKIEAALQEGRFQHGVVVADERWHEGVVGIVASRVTERYKRPAVVIGIREGVGKGSVRSFGGKDVLQAIRSSGQHLIGFGGHAHAAGLSLLPENLEALENAFNDALSRMEEDKSLQPLWLDARCAPEDLTPRTLQEIENLGPFGPGHPEPVFALKAKVHSQKILKERHLKLDLSGALEAIWFNAAEQSKIVEDTRPGEEAEWAGVPELNRFRGRVTPTLRIRDWKKYIVD